MPSIPLLPSTCPRSRTAGSRGKKTGADLVYKKKISLMDALLGFERMLTLLDGRRVPVVHDEVGVFLYLLFCCT